MKRLLILCGFLAVGVVVLSLLHPPGRNVQTRRTQQVGVNRLKAPGVPPILPFPRGKGRIAIVLDDWGYSLHQVPALQKIRLPVTVAVLPNLPYSTAVARSAHSSGHEVILHMPMEAQNTHAPREEGTLLSGMSPQQVLKRLARSYASVPYAKGISNHQGSKATVDRSLMEVVLGDAKRRDLFFLDSLVTNDSVCRQVAGEIRVPFAHRAVFLDNVNNPGAIRAQLLELVKTAGKNGGVIGIGHDRSGTLKVLQESLPELEQAGYELVPVSNLAEIPS